MNGRDALHILAAVGAVAAFVAYAVALARRPSWVRLANGSGLLFTGMALAQAAVLVREVRPPLSRLAELTVVMLLLAVAVQAWSALRNRRAWDGQERRTDAALEPVE